MPRGYFLFIEKETTSASIEHPDLSTYGILQLLDARWRGLSDLEKSIYQAEGIDADAIPMLGACAEGAAAA